MKKNILVFPCGSEIALEFYRSVHFSPHFRLIAVWENQVGNRADRTKVILLLVLFDKKSKSRVQTAKNQV